MKKHFYMFLAIFYIAILTAAAQTQQQTAPRGMPQQTDAIRKQTERMQALWDSLTTQQKGSIYLQIKHIYEPEVPVVQPGLKDSDPPSDAIVLFNGKDIDKEWEEARRQAPGATPGGSSSTPAVSWIIKDGAMEPTRTSGSIRTKRSFTDFQLHIEWKTPTEVTGTEPPGYPGQHKGNSGIVFAGGYELQILDSYNNPTYKNGQAGAVYLQHAPLVNVSKKPGEWQSFDILYTSPRFKDSVTYFTPPRITVFHNGVLIQNNVSIQGPTGSPGIPQYIINEHEPGPITLQRHGDPVAFRNVWIREL